MQIATLTSPFVSDVRILVSATTWVGEWGHLDVTRRVILVYRPHCVGSSKQTTLCRFHIPVLTRGQVESAVEGGNDVDHEIRRTTSSCLGHTSFLKNNKKIYVKLFGDDGPLYQRECIMFLCLWAVCTTS